MCHGQSSPDLSRRAATYVDMILKGARPQACLWNGRPCATLSSTSQ